jgi:plastocyanin
MKNSSPNPVLPCLVLLSLCAGLASADTTNVAFGSYFFTPNSVTIRAGDTVVWMNTGIASHSVTGTGSDPVCGAATVGSGCSHTFTSPGSYSYICNLPFHASFGMTGLVQVLPPVAVPAVLTNFALLGDGQAQFTVQSTAFRTNQVQASTNPGASSWTTISTLVPTTNSFIVTDSNAPAFQLRFYRVVQP